MNIASVKTTDMTESHVRISPASLLRSTGTEEAASQKSNIRTLQPVDKPGRDVDRQEKTGGSLSVEQTRDMVADLNEYMDTLQTQLGFSVREDLDRRQVVVEIKNRDTDEVIKQIPSEEMLKIMENMKELTGIIFNQSV